MFYQGICPRDVHDLGLTLFFSPDLEVRRKAISISLAMVTSRNVEEVVILLKKQLQRTMTEDYEKARIIPSILMSVLQENINHGFV